jgi:hypothetical protein
MPRCLLWKRVPGYTIPMVPMHLPPMAPMDRVEQIPSAARERHRNPVGHLVRMLKSKLPENQRQSGRRIATASAIRMEGGPFAASFGSACALPASISPRVQLDLASSRAADPSAARSEPSPATASGSQGLARHRRRGLEQLSAGQNGL